MRDFVALISASRPEVTIHLVDGGSVRALRCSVFGTREEDY
jgi:hypothetical protein